MLRNDTAGTESELWTGLILKSRPGPSMKLQNRTLPEPNI